MDYGNTKIAQRHALKVSCWSWTLNARNKEKRTSFLQGGRCWKTLYQYKTILVWWLVIFDLVLKNVCVCVCLCVKFITSHSLSQCKYTDTTVCTCVRMHAMCAYCMSHVHVCMSQCVMVNVYCHNVSHHCVGKMATRLPKTTAQWSVAQNWNWFPNSGVAISVISQKCNHFENQWLNSVTQLSQWLANDWVRQLFAHIVSQYCLQLTISERWQNRSSSLSLFVFLETFYHFPHSFSYSWLSQHPLLWFCQEPWIHSWLKTVHEEAHHKNLPNCLFRA